jgi:hypothetical protein
MTALRRASVAVGIRDFPCCFPNSIILFSLSTCSATAGEELIPDSYFSPEGWDETAVPWKHPPRVVAVVSGSGHVDTRTVLTSACGKSIITSAIKNPVSEVMYKKEYFYVATGKFEDSPPEERKRCGQRFVALGSKGLESDDQPLTAMILPEASWNYYAGRQLYYFVGK